jgi:hypothetical protein
MQFQDLPLEIHNLIIKSLYDIIQPIKKTNVSMSPSGTSFNVYSRLCRRTSQVDIPNCLQQRALKMSLMQGKKERVIQWLETGLKPLDYKEIAGVLSYCWDSDVASELIKMCSTIILEHPQAFLDAFMSSGSYVMYQALYEFLKQNEKEKSVLWKPLAGSIDHEMWVMEQSDPSLPLAHDFSTSIAKKLKIVYDKPKESWRDDPAYSILQNMYEERIFAPICRDYNLRAMKFFIKHRLYPGPFGTRAVYSFSFLDDRENPRLQLLVLEAIYEDGQNYSTSRTKSLSLQPITETSKTQKTLWRTPKLESRVLMIFHSP